MVMTYSDTAEAAAPAATTTCALCNKTVSASEAQRGQPLITARQLASTIWSTALHSPGLLGEVLMKELPQVDYCPECREIVAERRQTEQLKFLVSALLILAIIIGVPLLLVLR